MSTVVIEKPKTTDTEKLRRNIDELGIYLESSRDKYENDIKEGLNNIIESLSPENTKAINSILENSTAKRLRCEVRDSLKKDVKKIPIQDLSDKLGSDVETTRRRLLICILANLLSEPPKEDCDKK